MQDDQQTPTHVRTTLLDDFGSYRNISAAVGIHAETVRRHLSTGKIGASLLRALVTKLGYSPIWVLTGEGPKMTADYATSLVRTVDSSVLVHELEARLTPLLALSHQISTSADDQAVAAQLDEVKPQGGDWGNAKPLRRTSDSGGSV